MTLLARATTTTTLLRRGPPANARAPSRMSDGDRRPRDLAWRGGMDRRDRGAEAVMTTSAAPRTTTFDFTGSVALVTGGGSGIGRSIAHALLDAGATVVVSGRRRAQLDETLAGHDAARTFARPTDIADGADVRALVAEVVERFGRLDVVVSNAAGYVPGDITELDDEAWASMRATNVDGFFHLAKASLPVLAEHGGSFVAVSSVSGLAGDWAQAGYNATKAAVSNFVRSLALDWGKSGVRINAVAPALTRTEPTRAVWEDPALAEQFADRTAAGRIGEPDEIAPAVLFLASDAASYVSGVILPVDGGTSASTGQAHA
jgi:meso-butanediol dehydrogenase/(S,S)-butanediol dehydrogenase/diacetyl reductase